MAMTSCTDVPGCAVEPRAVTLYVVGLCEYVRPDICTAGSRTSIITVAVVEPPALLALITYGFAP